MIVDREKLASLREFRMAHGQVWFATKSGHVELLQLIDTLETLWKVARAAEIVVATMDHHDSVIDPLRETLSALNQFGLPAGNAPDPRRGTSRTLGDQ